MTCFVISTHAFFFDTQIRRTTRCQKQQPTLTSSPDSERCLPHHRPSEPACAPTLEEVRLPIPMTRAQQTEKKKGHFRRKGHVLQPGETEPAIISKPTLVGRRRSGWKCPCRRCHHWCSLVEARLRDVLSGIVRVLEVVGRMMTTGKVGPDDDSRVLRVDARTAGRPGQVVVGLLLLDGQGVLTERAG